MEEIKMVQFKEVPEKMVRFSVLLEDSVNVLREYLLPETILEEKDLEMHQSGFLIRVNFSVEIRTQMVCYEILTELKEKDYIVSFERLFPGEQYPD
ncbi:MAG: hypothetical protein ABIG40_01050 [Parcubacteria group bacterium]